MKKSLLNQWINIKRVSCRLWVIVMHHPKALFLAGIIIGSFLGFIISVFVTEASYRLTNGSVQLIGDANPALADKLKFDKNVGAYRFNAEAITPEMTGETDPSKIAALLASQKQQTGGGGKDSQNMYSLDLPIDPSMGTKIYDVNSKTSFKLIPEFDMGVGRTESGRVVYPLDEGGQAVYTVKANGIKEDIVLQKPRGDELSFKYKLELPKTLEARLDERGNLGIYSVDPMVATAVAGALQNGSSTDTERLKDVQQNGTKTHLAYLIPAPTIVQSGSQPQGHKAKAMYRLNGDQLTVETMGLETLTYPISIDPTVVVTSTSDFIAGDNEGMIQFDTDAISRATLTGGVTAAWATTTSLNNARSSHATVVYNGYIYAIDGIGTSGVISSLEFAPLNANGTIGTWSATTAPPGGGWDHAAVAYNSYLYVIGGGFGSTAVYYAPLNADGTVGTWTQTASMLEARALHKSAVYNGYVYAIGGGDGANSASQSVEYAPLNADGSVGTWSYTTSLNQARQRHSVEVYNGYVYVIGGDSGTTDVSTVYSAPLNANGTVGAWTSTTALLTPSSGQTSMVYAGYLYVLRSFSGVAEYAPIYAAGNVGAWSMTSNLNLAAGSSASVAYNGYLYRIAGSTGNSITSVEYSQIIAMSDPSMTMPTWATTTAMGAGVTTRRSHASLAYRGVLYVIGGLVSTTANATVHYATINANGTIGAWAATSALPSARYDHSAAMNNHFMYVTGGRDAANGYMTTVYYTGVNNTTGAVAAWAATTALPAGRSNHTTVVHNNYIYVVGGLTTGDARVDTVYYAPLNADGTVGTWNTTTVLPATRASHQSIIYNNFLYVVGGNTGSVVASVMYAPINSNGTIGSWTTAASSMGTARELFAAVMFAGHIVAIGGYSGSGLLATSEYSKINPDGSLGTWIPTSSFVSARQGHAAAIYNGIILMSGGWNRATTYYGTVQYRIPTYKSTGERGNLGTVGTWQLTTAANVAVYGQASVVYNNRIYLIGGIGASSVYLNNIRYAPINQGGTIGAWTTSPNLMGLARFNAGAVVHNGYLYVVGGQQSAGVVTNTVEYAPINADGTIGTWTTSGNTFTTARYGHVTAIYNGYLYVVGGGDSADTALGDVKYAPINSNGTVGAWASSTATIPTFDADGFVYGGRIYTVGGRNGANYYATVRYATINADGTIGTWREASEQMPEARSRIAATALNGYIYASGGIQVVGSTTTLGGSLYYAAIKADGSIGHWLSTNSVSTSGDGTTSLNYHNLVSYRGQIYSLAGTASGGSPFTPRTQTYMFTDNAPALSGTYTKRVDLGQPSTLNSIVMNGTLPAGQENLMFRTAGADGIYGTWKLPSSLVGTPLSDVRYLMYKVTLDDSASSSLYASTGRSSITDITADYTIPAVLTPENRLRQNKFFDASGILQPLQTQ